MASLDHTASAAVTIFAPYDSGVRRSLGSGLARLRLRLRCGRRRRAFPLSFALIAFSATMRGDNGNLLPSISTVSTLTSSLRSSSVRESGIGGAGVLAHAAGIAKWCEPVDT